MHDANDSMTLPGPRNISVRHAAHADEHSANFTGWSNEFTQVAPGAFEGLAREIWLGPIQLFHDAVNRPTRYRGCAWQRSRVLLSFLPTDGPVYYGEKRVPPRTVLTYRWDDAARFNFRTGFESAGVCVDEDFLEEHAGSVWRLPLDERHRASRPAVGCATAGRDVQDTLLRLVNRICECPAILESTLAAGVIADDLLEIFISTLGADAHARERPPPPSVRSYTVYKAQQFIEERLATGFSMSELCKAVRVSRRALEYAFRDVVGLSPRRYIMALRLGRARRDIAGGTLASISDIAQRWGFFHLGRFSALYKGFFGSFLPRRRAGNSWSRPNCRFRTCPAPPACYALRR
jgi:AraC family transcriptional regulator, ethanolamine operon transcriptional activator